MGFMDRLKGVAESAQAATSKVGVGASRGQMDLANRAQKADEGWRRHRGAYRRDGVHRQHGHAGRHRVQHHAHVSPAGGTAYSATVNQYIYPSNPFATGENVTVKVDPDDPNVMMIFGRV